jgi:3-methylcrotonyl-CoA carboxylase alpha subunit
MVKISRILIANRGEIACRIIHTARRLGIKSTAIYASGEQYARHVMMADEAVQLKGSGLSATYLDKDQIIAIAHRYSIDAIHPGYGFLSESAAFAEACEREGFLFLGPDPKEIAFMGNKIRARELAISCGVPVLPSLEVKAKTRVNDAGGLRLPVLVKAAEGGGGKGMRIVYAEDQLEAAIESASREALDYFADGSVYLEEYSVEPKHIEVQIFGDGKGNVIHLFERECSIQRRYQKIIEEAPSPSIDSSLRGKITAMAVQYASSRNYRSAGTVEFILTPSKEIYFLEMNTRIQVEHPVTEAITGMDLVEMQIRLAEKGVLPCEQDEIQMRGHAIEARVYAEDPYSDFVPSPGTIQIYREPELEGIRIDSAYDRPGEIQELYDPMISKLISYGIDREDARKRIDDALSQYHILGVSTNIAYLKTLVQQPEFIDNSYSTHFTSLIQERLLYEFEKTRNLIPLHLPVLCWVIAQLNYNSFNKGSSEGDYACEFNFLRPYSQFRVQLERNELQGTVSTLGAKLEITVNGKVYHPQWKWENDHGEIFAAGKSYPVWVTDPYLEQVFINLNGIQYCLSRYPSPDQVGKDLKSDQSESQTEQMIVAPLHGKIIKMNFQTGDSIHKGDVLLVIEAMKMENNILAPAAGTIGKVMADKGMQVKKDQHILQLILKSNELL